MTERDPVLASEQPVRVLVADDEALIRAGFRLLIESAPGLEVVGEAADGIAAVRQARTLSPDVVLMDIRMPLMDGLEATRLIAAGPASAGPGSAPASAVLTSAGPRSAIAASTGLGSAPASAGPGSAGPGAALAAGAPVPRVLIVTTFDADEHVFAALRAGASGFVLKDTPPEQLLDAVRVVAAGEALLTPAITRRLIAEFARQPARPAAGDGALAALTGREREVLARVAAGESNAEIAAGLHLSVATVKTHVSRLLAKLVLRDRAQLVVLAYETGVATPSGQLPGPSPLA